MSKSLLPLFLKVGTCAAIGCTTGIPANLALGILGNTLHDFLKDIPGRLRLRPLGEPNHDLQKALARAISQASQDVELESMIRDATRSLTDLQPPFHYQVEQFLDDLRRRPEEILQTPASNSVLKTFLEAPSPQSFQPLASAFGEEHLPGLPPDLRASIVEAIHLRIAARFWDEIKGDNRAWRAYSAEVFAELCASLANLATGQHEILAALGQREIHIAAAPAILPQAAAAIDITRADLEKDFQALHHKLDSLLRGQREIKGDTARIRHAIPCLVGLLILGLGIGWFTLGRTKQIAAAAAISKAEDLKQTELLEKLFAAKEEQTREFLQAGRRIEDIPQEDLEADLARRISLPVESLRARIAAGLKSADALTRSRAELLAGQRDAAIATATEVKHHNAEAIQQLIAADKIIAQAHDEKAEYLPALAARQRIAALIDSHAEPLPWADAQHEVAYVLDDLARHAEAVALLQQVIRIKEQELDPADPSIANSLNNLASLLRDQGQLAEAEPLYRRALGILEAKLGKNHPDVATILNNLALLLQDQGKLAEAEPLYRRALEISEAELGKDHRAVATRLNNLALLMRAQGKLAEAELLFRRAIEIGEAKLGKDHPDVATWLNNLARHLQDQDKLAEAEPPCRRALEISEAKLGKDHPDVATVLNNLASLLEAQGKLAEAEPLFRRAIEIGEAKLGKDHPGVAIELNNLARLLQDQGNLAEAEPLSRRHLLIFFLHRKRDGAPFEHEQAAVKNYTRLLEAMQRSPEQIEAEIAAIKKEADLSE